MISVRKAIDGSAWAKPKFGPLYGTTTLVDKSLVPKSRPFRVLVSSRFSRDALFVDIKVHGAQEGLLRLCNVHLESLVAKPPVRPLQVARAAKHLKMSSVYASVLAGDLNAVEPFDRTLHSDNDLKDAYLELGSKEDHDEGYTWGQQAHPALRERFGCSRMDKVFYRGEGGFKLQSLERFGDDVVVGASDKAESDGILALGFPKAWITDHLGLKAVFTVGSDHRL